MVVDSGLSCLQIWVCDIVRFRTSLFVDLEQPWLIRYIFVDCLLLQIMVYLVCRFDSTLFTAVCTLYTIVLTQFGPNIYIDNFNLMHMSANLCTSKLEKLQCVPHGKKL
ncbi:hypothetical protein CHS0354_042237 [Potamilus streckersoni]|uniref:Uncharacterized protein n=1 Tax=Potamilus streckersoni TaxID=2493646 RepID=A0AAE0W2I0_9BIVA|nr:hypothetical protein CHS0354_042237 [Potamilus streckersoni]